jgi:hypothetical protein
VLSNVASEPASALCLWAKSGQKLTLAGSECVRSMQRVR